MAYFCAPQVLHSGYRVIVADLVFASVVGHTAAKRNQWQVEHELRKYELALVHRGFVRNSAKTTSQTNDLTHLGGDFYTFDLNQ
jgi:uncharacterized protein YbgA (DUF1722 family)